MAYRFKKSLVATMTAVSVLTAGITVAEAATPTVIGSQCTVDGIPALHNLGELSGATGRYFTELQRVIRDDNPELADQFAHADDLNRRLADSGGSDRGAAEEVAKVYVSIDSAMHNKGYKFGEWRLAFPQTIANNQSYDPRVPLDPGQAAAVAANEAGFLQALIDQDVPGKLTAYVDNLRKLRTNASPRLQINLDIPGDRLIDQAEQLKFENWNAIAADYARAAAGCAQAFADQGQGQPASSFARAVPQLYVPNTAKIGGASGPGDTGVFAPLEAVNLYQGNSSDLRGDAWLTVISVLIAIAAASGPAIMRNLGDFIAHPPTFFPPAG